MSEIKNFIIEDGVLKKYTGYDTEITIPDGVTVIGKKAFKSNSMRKVVMPESVIEIGDSAFYGCLYLEEVQLSPELQTIGKYAFYLCKLKSIEIPSSVKVIGDQSFGFDLKNITLLCENAKISGTAFNWDAKFSGPKKLYDRLLEENVSFKYGKKRWKNIEVSLEKCGFESQMPIVKNASDIKNTVNSDVEVIIDQLKAKYADYPAYALKQVEMECKDISLSKLKKWLKETQSKTLGVYLQEIGVIDAYKHSQVMEARKKEEKEIREQQKKDYAANLENNKSAHSVEKNQNRVVATNNNDAEDRDDYKSILKTAPIGLSPLENVKKLSLQTLEQIYRRLGERRRYYQGASGLFEIRISKFDYELLEQDSLFMKYSLKAQNYAATALNELRNPYFKNSAIRTASFENAVIFQWEDIVSVVELAYFINMYNVPSFTMELYLAESEYDKPFCFTITNKDECFKIKTKRV